MTKYWREQPSLASVAAAQVADTGKRAGEMAVSSAIVVGARTMLIGAAMANPIGGDYRELGRMLPEKIVALSASGLALAGSLAGLQQEMMAQVADLALLALGGVPTQERLSRLADDSVARGGGAFLWPLAAFGAAVRPMHRTVTDNARRLGKAD